MAVNYLRSARHLLTCGKSGMGKTTWALEYMKGAPHDRIAIYDHQDEFAFRMGAKIATTIEEFLTLMESERVVCFQFGKNYAGYKREMFAEFCDVVFDTAEVLNRKGLECLFVCDELQQFVTGTQIESAPAEFRQILETGRRRGLDSLSLSRAPNRVNVAIREEFTELILFKLNDEQSLKFARDVGADTDAVAALPPHHYLYYNIISGREAGLKLEFKGKKTVTTETHTKD